MFAKQAADLCAGLQEKANQEAAAAKAAAKAAASEDPLAPPQTQQRHEVRAFCICIHRSRLALAFTRKQLEP
jgi:hypothetical protein